LQFVALVKALGLSSLKLLEWWNTCLRCQYYQYAEVSNRNTSLSARQCFNFCGLCKRDDQYKLYPNRRIFRPLSVILGSLRNVMGRFVPYGTEMTLFIICVYTALCRLCDGCFRIFEFLVMAWLSFRRWFLFTDVIYVYCVCGIGMFLFVMRSVSILLSVVSCVWFFSSMGFASLELVVVVWCLWNLSVR
jgi:hypothetical protein